LEAIGSGFGACGEDLGNIGRGFGACGEDLGNIGRGFGACGEGLGNFGRGFGACGEGLGTIGRGFGACGEDLGNIGRGFGACGEAFGKSGGRSIFGACGKVCDKGIEGFDGSSGDDSKEPGFRVDVLTGAGLVGRTLDCCNELGDFDGVICTVGAANTPKSITGRSIRRISNLCPRKLRQEAASKHEMKYDVSYFH